MHRSRVSRDGPFACPRIRFQPWKRSEDESSVQTVASLGEHRQSRIHKTAAGEWPKSQFLSAFDEPTLNGVIENFIASTDWHPVEQTIRADLSVDVREYAARIKTPTLLIIAKHDQIVPPTYSENLVPGAKTIELNSGHLIFLEKPVELASAILSFCQ
jgi:pimeloyl-ACP methyl ester carboxylesterase